MNKALSKYFTSTPDHHSLLEDMQGILTGATLSALGALFLATAGLLTGGTAGVAFLIAYLTGYSFGLIFFVVNFPFYYFAWRQFGFAFCLKTFAGVGLVSVLSEVFTRLIVFETLDPLMAGLLAGLLIGSAMLVLFRHRASLGGFGILALYVQDRFGFKAGYVQLGLDLLVLIASFFVVSPYVILCSIAGAIVMNMILAINHRNDRYIAR